MSAHPALQTGIDFNKLFEPDALITAQFYNTTRRTYHAEPELRLMAAILEDAVATLTTDPRRCTDQRRRDFAGALDWIARPEQNGWLFSFASICESLDIDPIHLRQGLLRKIAEVHDSKATIGSKGRPTHRSSRGKLSGSGLNNDR
jgi:hypothetical protein